MTTHGQFQQAKIDHYVERVEDFHRMARYPAARRAIEVVFTLDPENLVCQNIRQEIDDLLTEMRIRKSGNSNGNGNGSPGDRKPGVALKRGEVVLMVDQDERVLTRLSSALRRHGYRFVGAATYDEAVEILTMLDPDIVVSEVNFDTGARGFDLFLWLRTNASYLDLPFLFHATRIDRDVLVAGKRFGVDDFILKPADDNVLAAAVTQSLLRRKPSLPVQ